MPGIPIKLSDKGRGFHNFAVETYDKRRLQKVEKYLTDNGDGTYSGLYYSETYTYDSKGRKLEEILHEEFDADGVTVLRSWKTKYFTISVNGNRVVKRGKNV